MLNARKLRRLGGFAVLALAGTLWAGAAAADEAASASTPADQPDQRETRQIRMDVENWKWIPDVIRVPQGARVVLQIRSFDATHRFDLKAYGLKVPLPQDKLTTVEFVADKAGEFTWKCGRPCGNGCPKMTGKLIVLPEGEPESEPGG